MQQKRQSGNDNRPTTVLEEIYANTESICLALDMMRKDYNKIIYALLGIIAATVGMKFVGTPLIVDICIYLSLFAGVFVSGVTGSMWKLLNNAQRGLRVAFSSFLLFNGITQTVIYQPGSDVAPTWFPPAIHVFLIVIAGILIWTTWILKPAKYKGISTKNLCRHPEKVSNDF